MGHLTAGSEQTPGGLAASDGSRLERSRWRAAVVLALLIWSCLALGFADVTVGATNTTFLQYRPERGQVQEHPTVYPIFWGSNWNQGSGPQARASVLRFYEGLSSSPYQGILTQYFDTAGHISSSVAVASPYTDTATTAPQNITPVNVEEEVHAAIATNRWTSEINAQFAVFMAPGFTNSRNYVIEVENKFGADSGSCAFHFSTVEGHSPYTAVGYEGTGDSPCTTRGEVQLQVATSHEYAEAATDPVTMAGAKGAWDSQETYEIGDVCQSDGEYELPDGVWVQKLWDNDQLSCSLADLQPSLVYASTEEAEPGQNTRARLRGTVNPEGLHTTYYFEYGPTTSYGSRTPEVSAGSSMNNQSATAMVGGLQIGGSYHFRLVATNSTGTVHGIDVTYVQPSRSWRLEEVPTPGGSVATNLSGGVSCTSEEACMAAGGYVDGQGTERALTETWNGTMWTIQNIAEPATKSGSGFGDRLTGVSCTQPDACTAVGSYAPVTGNEQAPLAERWNGEEWTIQQVPQPAGVGVAGDSLNAVACAAPTACTAVGSEHLASGLMVPFAEKWNGQEWRVEAMAQPNRRGSAKVLSVSCSAATACTAVGSYENATGKSLPLAEASAGSGWLVQPTVKKGTSLEDVSCTSTTFCIAVSSYPVKGANRLLTERWNGTEWNKSPASAPSLSTASWLHAVTCTTPEACTAVGGYSKDGDGGVPALLIESLGAGETWTEVREVPSPRWGVGASGAVAAHGVSCAADGACVIIGQYIGESGLESPFSEVY